MSLRRFSSLSVVALAGCSSNGIAPDVGAVRTSITPESKAELDEFDGDASLEDLSRSAKQLRLEEEPAVAALDEAVQELDTQESVAVDAFASQGIAIDPDETGDGGGAPRDS